MIFFQGKAVLKFWVNVESMSILKKWLESFLNRRIKSSEVKFVKFKRKLKQSLTYNSKIFSVNNQMQTDVLSKP